MHVLVVLPAQAVRFREALGGSAGGTLIGSKPARALTKFCSIILGIADVETWKPRMSLVWKSWQVDGAAPSLNFDEGEGTGSSLIQ